MYFSNRLFFLIPLSEIPMKDGEKFVGSDIEL